jgi:hypothetical protein
MLKVTVLARRRQVTFQAAEHDAGGEEACKAKDGDADVRSFARSAKSGGGGSRPCSTPSSRRLPMR